MYDDHSDNCDVEMARGIMRTFCHQEDQGSVPERLELGICDRKLVAV
jgi:hypothetical protein